jgi:hypothetical protein
MGILNLGNSEEFEEFEDDSYYEFSSDHEFDGEDAGTGNGHKRAIAMGFAAAVLFIGGAFGAKIALSGNSSVEFGQGSTQTVTCQSTALTVTPFAGFINDTSTSPATGRWTLDSVYIEGISPTCSNTDFTVQVFDNGQTNSPLGTSDSATSKAATPYTYVSYTAAKFYMGSDSSTIASLSNAYTDIENATDPTADTTASVQITFDPDLVADFANAQSVYKIVVETSPHPLSETITATS